MTMRIVIALGGNALLQRGEAPEARTQRRHLDQAVAAIANIVLSNKVVITHGNGPQIGLLALQSYAAGQVAKADSLDILGAESEGMLGYLIEQELRSQVLQKEVATLLTLVEVAADDPAFLRPEKPIGPVYRREEAERLQLDRHWSIAPDGEYWRRVVPSPEPRRLIGLSSIRLLLDAGATVVCAGGGGVPVTIAQDGRLRGVEAVIDKDLSAALLARQVGAEALLLLTDVDAVYSQWGAADASPIRNATPAQLRSQTFAVGSMAPKVEAACRFAESCGIAAIGRLEDATALLAGTAGTQVRRLA